MHKSCQGYFHKNMDLLFDTILRAYIAEFGSKETYMSQSAKPKKAEAVKRGGGAQKIYENIRASILNLDRKPEEPLDEASLSQQFGMSRSPVREALIRLSTNGLGGHLAQ